MDLLQHQAFQDAHALTVAPPLPDLSALRSRKRDRLAVLMKTLSTNENNLPCPSDIHMANFHPTEQETKNLLQYIETKVPIIHNPDFITNPRIYNGVQSVYRYGCITCMKHLKLDHTFTCPACQTLSAANPFSGTGEAFLTAPVDSFDAPPGEVDMADPDKKRSSGDDIAELPNKLQKPNGGD